MTKASAKSDMQRSIKSRVHIEINQVPVSVEQREQRPIWFTDTVARIEKEAKERRENWELREAKRLIAANVDPATVQSALVAELMRIVLRNSHCTYEPLKVNFPAPSNDNRIIRPTG